MGGGGGILSDMALCAVGLWFDPLMVLSKLTSPDYRCPELGAV